MFAIGTLQFLMGLEPSELRIEAILGIYTFWRTPSQMKDHPGILGDIMTPVIRTKEQFLLGKALKNI